MVVKLINVQVLTQNKMCESVDQLEENTSFCTTETQHKYQKIRVKESIKLISSMRELEDTKGGGLMIMHKDNKCFILEKHSLNIVMDYMRNLL